MTTVRTLATLRTDFPDDSIWSEDGDTEIRMAGEAIAKAIAKMLSDIGCEVDEPFEEPEHGWRLHASIDRRSLLFQVTDLREEVLLHCEDTSWLNKILNRNHPAFVDTLKGLNQALSQDGRFHDVHWHINGDGPDVPASRDPVG